MTMNWKEFDEKYPGLAGALASEFHDSETVDDERIARNMDKDLAAADRIDLLRELLEDAKRLMANMDSDWQVMIAMANRRIYNSDDARAWLALVMGAWKAELSRLENNGTNP